MKFSTFITLLYTLAVAVADLNQQIITNTRRISDVEHYIAQTVVPFTIFVPALLKQLPGNVSVSVDSTGTLQVGLTIDRPGDPFTFSRTVNLTRKHQIASTFVDTTHTTCTVHLDRLVVGVPVTVPIAIPIPGSKETGIGNATISLNGDNKLGVATTIQADKRSVSISDNVSVGFPAYRATSPPETYCANTALRADDCWEGDCPPGCCTLPAVCTNDQDCRNKPGAYDTCECHWTPASGNFCHCITISAETSVNIASIIGVDGNTEVDIFF